jgi:hypothetical protein
MFLWSLPQDLGDVPLRSSQSHDKSLLYVDVLCRWISYMKRGVQEQASISSGYDI